MTDSRDQPAELASAPELDRFRPADPMAGNRLQYHRSMLWISIVALVVAALLPAPVNGTLRLPLVDLPLPELCAWQRHLGVDCPGCGLTRCFISMAHGHWAEAWGFHPVGTILFLMVAAQLPFRAWQMRQIVRQRYEWRHPLLAALPWILLTLLLGQWVWRVVSHFT